jgi:uncharacterized protein YdhG (YjbR/CyaY superfamily)
MQSQASTVDAYLTSLPQDRQQAIAAIRKAILKNLPAGFVEQMSYGMIGYVVPHSLYPAGYHCTPALPLPYMNVASQKSFIAIYHMGIYANAQLLKWFTDECSKQITGKLDMGKSCIRFKNPANIPFDLLGELAGTLSASEWIELYEKNYLVGKKP